MELAKRSLIYIFIILLVVSIYKDLSNESVQFNKTNNNSNSEIVTSNNTNVVKVKVKQGENILYIVEKINNMNHNELNVEEIISDFKRLNPHVDTYNLQEGRFYYFPLYN